jgi:hypothetical protein
MQIEESLECLIALQCKWLWLCSKTICKLQIGIDLQASLMFKQMLFEVERLLDHVSKRWKNPSSALSGRRTWVQALPWFSTYRPRAQISNHGRACTPIQKQCWAVICMITSEPSMFYLTAKRCPNKAVRSGRVTAEWVDTVRFRVRVRWGLRHSLICCRLSLSLLLTLSNSFAAYLASPRLLGGCRPVGAMVRFLSLLAFFLVPLFCC